jgi:hypothetical protein
MTVSGGGLLKSVLLKLQTPTPNGGLPLIGTFMYSRIFVSAHSLNGGLPRIEGSPLAEGPCRIRLWLLNPSLLTSPLFVIFLHYSFFKIKVLSIELRAVPALRDFALLNIPSVS